MSETSRLAGQACIVTGASRGLGAAIAGRLWQAGARLLLVGRSLEGLEGATDEIVRVSGRPGVRTSAPLAFACDLSDADAPARVIEEARRRLGGVRVLVNNAGIQGPIGPAWENDWAAWEHAFRVNFLAPAELCRRAIAIMSKAGGGKIINISGGGATAARPCFSAYAAAKSGLVRLSETLAMETRDRMVDINCVAPGAMSSTMTAEVLTAGPERAGEREFRDAERIRQQGAPSMERAAALCEFLASPASDGVTGKLISAVWDPWEELGARVNDLQRSDVYTLRRIVPADRGLDWGRD